MVLQKWTICNSNDFGNNTDEIQYKESRLSSEKERVGII